MLVLVEIFVCKINDAISHDLSTSATNEGEERWPIDIYMVFV